VLALRPFHIAFFVETLRLYAEPGDSSYGIPVGFWHVTVALGLVGLFSNAILEFSPISLAPILEFLLLVGESLVLCRASPEDVGKGVRRMVASVVCCVLLIGFAILDLGESKRIRWQNPRDGWIMVTNIVGGAALTEHCLASLRFLFKPGRTQLGPVEDLDDS